MSNYVKSEFYRVLHYKWTYLFIGICSFLLLSSNVVLAVVKYTDSSFPYANTYFSFSNLYSNIIIVYILCIMVSNMIYGNENNNHTMKNSVSYGISRGTIYFGKLLVEIVYAMIAFIIIAGVHVISGYLLLENSGPIELELIIRTYFACLPFLIFALATMNCFAFIMESSGAIAASCGLLIAFPSICNLLGMRFLLFNQLAKILPWNLINNIEFDYAKHVLHLYWEAEAGYYYYWLIGIIQMVLIAMVGYVLFRKKEIK